MGGGAEHHRQLDGNSPATICGQEEPALIGQEEPALIGQEEPADRKQCAADCYQGHIVFAELRIRRIVLNNCTITIEHSLQMSSTHKLINPSAKLWQTKYVVSSYFSRPPPLVGLSRCRSLGVSWALCLGPIPPLVDAFRSV